MEQREAGYVYMLKLSPYAMEQTLALNLESPVTSIAFENGNMVVTHSKTQRDLRWFRYPTKRISRHPVPLCKVDNPAQLVRIFTHMKGYGALVSFGQLEGNPDGFLTIGWFDAVRGGHTYYCDGWTAIYETTIKRE